MPEPAASGPNPQSQMQSALSARLTELFPDGRLPDPVQLRDPGQATGATGAAGQSGPTGHQDHPIGVTGPAPTTGPASTGATGPASTGPASTGPTGAGDSTTGPTDTPPPGVSGASGPTATQLDEAGKKMDIKAGTAFKFVRDENAELVKTNAALTAKLKEAEGKAITPTDAAEVKALRDKVTRYEDALAISNVEATEDFQKNIARPLSKAEADLKAIAVKYEIPAGDLAAALANPDPSQSTDKLTELSAGLNRLDLIRFDQLTIKIAQLSEQRQGALSEAAEKWKGHQERQDAAAKVAANAFESSWKSALEASALKLDKDGFFKPTGDATKDAQLEKAKAEVRGLDVTNLSNEDLAERLYRAAAFPLLLTELSEAMATIGSKDQEITKLRGSQPPGGGGDLPANTGPTGIAGSESFRDVLKTKLAGVLPA